MKTEKKDNRFEVVKAEKVSPLREATVLRDKQTEGQSLTVLSNERIAAKH